MQRKAVELSVVMTVAWLAVVAICLLAGLTALAVVILLAPGVIWVLALLGLRVYWQRHPEHRKVGDWFTEEHHIGHW